MELKLLAVIFIVQPELSIINKLQNEITYRCQPGTQRIVCSDVVIYEAGNTSQSIKGTIVTYGINSYIIINLFLKWKFLYFAWNFT